MERIKSYAEQIIPIIRANDPDGLIIVGTPAWSSLGISDDPPSGDDILKNRLSGEFAHNVLYSFHFYARPTRNLNGGRSSRSSPRNFRFSSRNGGAKKLRERN